jgi:outer membrane protein
LLTPAAAGLYPTLAVVGDYTYANPNQRIFPPSAVFTGTWELGVQLSFDVGGLPSTLAQMSSADQDTRKARLQAEKQRTSIILDVQTCLLALDRARSDLELTLGAVPQAQENLRVVQQKFANGVAKRSEVLEAELGLARARFSVESKQVDVRIAEADLARAEALDSF